MKLKTEFDFDAAHRLVGHKGKCNNLHGHVWKVLLEIEGDKLDDIGILWDFGKRKELKDEFDHKTILKECPENAKLIDVIIKTCGMKCLYLMENNPTAEHLCSEIIGKLINSNPHLGYKVTVYESKDSSCEMESKK